MKNNVMYINIKMAIKDYEVRIFKPQRQKMYLC